MNENLRHVIGSLVSFAALALPAASQTSSTILMEDFSGPGANLPPNWSFLGGAPPMLTTTSYVGYPVANGCFSSDSLQGTGGQALLQNDEFWAPPACGITNTTWARTPLLKAEGNAISISFDYALSITSADAASVRLMNGALGAPPPVLIASTSAGLQSTGNWTRLEAVVPAVTVQAFEAFGGFQIEVRLSPAAASGSAGFALDNLDVSTILEWTKGCIGNSIQCPCGNFNRNGACTSVYSNYVDSGELSPEGSTSLSVDNLSFHASQMKPTTAAVLASSSGLLPTPQAFGRGALCMSFPIRRHGVVFTDALGEARWMGQNLMAAGGWGVGSSVHFQVLYRDAPLPPGQQCGAPAGDFNLTNSVSITVTP